MPEIDDELAEKEMIIEASNRVRSMTDSVGWKHYYEEIMRFKEKAFNDLINENYKGVDLEKAQARYRDITVFGKIHEAIIHNGNIMREELEHSKKMGDAISRSRSPHSLNSNQ